MDATGVEQEQTASAESAPDEQCRTACSTADCAWPAIGWHEWLPVAIALAVVTTLTARCLPPSICLGDFGDLQLAAATLGIAHPPGYAIFATLLYPFTVIPGLDPMFGVSVGCLVSGLTALAVGMLTLIRLGINAWIAAAAMALTIQYSRVRLNLIAPEVYMPTLLFLASAIYLALRHSRRGRPRDLVLAGLCFGVAVFSRPPIVLCAPFFLAAWWLSENQRESGHAGPARRWRGFLWLCLATALPGAYAFGYSLVRDDPDTRYNYIEHFNLDEQPLPTLEEGLTARVHRAVWLISGQQFNEYLRFNIHRLRRMVIWLRNEITPAGYGWTPFVSIIVLTAAGIGATWRRSSPSALLLVGLIAQCFLYLCMYEMHGQAADILPLLFAGAAFVGVAVWQLIALLGRMGSYAAVALFALAMVVNITEVLPSRLCRPSWVDAQWFVNELRLEALPQHAVILAMWDESLPIRYVQTLTSPRPDITIVNSSFHRWPPLCERYAKRPVFVSRPLDWLPEQYRSEPVGPIWRVHRLQQ